MFSVNMPVSKYCCIISFGDILRVLSGRIIGAGRLVEFTDATENFGAATRYPIREATEAGAATEAT